MRSYSDVFCPNCRAKVDAIVWQMADEMLHGPMYNRVHDQDRQADWRLDRFRGAQGD